MSVWSVQVQNSSFQTQGEALNFKEFKLPIFVNKVRQCSFKVRLDNPISELLLTAASPRYIKVYRNQKLVFYGPVITVQEVGQTGSNAEESALQINALGPEWIFAKRLVGKTAAGLKWAAGKERASRFAELIAAMEGEGASLLLNAPAPHTQSTSTAAYETTPFRTLAEVLSDIAETFEGFDWIVNPTEYTASNKFLGYLETKDLIGSSKPNAVFEWGTGRCNVANYTRVIDRTEQINRGYHNTTAGPEAPGAPTVLKEDTTSKVTWGVQEALIQASILNTALRESLVQENIKVRKVPRQTIAFQPVPDDGTGRVPQVFTDFGIGDTIRARIALNNLVHFDALVRCYGCTFELDEALRETQVLTLSE
jgi:hypothetical protein